MTDRESVNGRRVNGGLALRAAGLGLLLGLGLAACGAEAAEESRPTAEPAVAGSVYVVRDTTIRAELDVAGVAQPYARSTLSTKLMGTVEAVLVHEGDGVRAGQPLVRIDARDLRAKMAQVEAQIARAQAVHRDARRQAERMRALYADDAAPRAQLDAAETGLAQAEAAVRAAEAAAVELDANIGYSVVRAPFAGTVTQRLVDPGAFAAPGAPLVTVQAGDRLRIVADAPPRAVRDLARGDTVRATIEGRAAVAVVEGVVPARGGNLYTVNAIVDNAGGTHLPGSAARLALRQGARPALAIPHAAVIREGDLTGVRIQRPEGGSELRWLRLGRSLGDGLVEVLSGLQAGERVIVVAEEEVAASVDTRTAPEA